MRPAVAIVPLLALLAAVLTSGGSHPRLARAGQPPAALSGEPGAGKPRVKLAVLVVFDQLRADMIDKWRPLFGTGGFVRLEEQGAWFTRCYYPYGTTSTGPGHASMLTGTSPDRHGIVNNNWYEPAAGDVYCAGSDRYELVPPAPKANPADAKQDVKGKAAPRSFGTPDRLLSETVADVLKQTYGDKAKIFGLSLKDRSAILPTGKKPDGAFWFTGRFVTSTYYTDTIDRRFPAWLTAFNESKAADAWFGKDWVRARPAAEYDRYAGPDDAPGEGPGDKQGLTFPHPTTGGAKGPGKAYYEALANSPYGNDLLLDLAKRCVREEQLGKDDVPDLLVVSFSSNDLIGHTWGPDSHEVLDVTVRSDALMADLLTFLDTEVGRGAYALGLTADHGICPLPEVSVTKGRDAKRVDPAAVRGQAEQHLRRTFGGPAEEPAAGTGADEAADKKVASGWVEAFSYPWFYLNPRLVAASGKTRAEVARSLADYLATRPDTHRAFTRDDLAGDFPASDEIGRRVKRAFHPDRCGDVYLVNRPYDLVSKPTATGTNHGSPHGYDAHVPLLVYGPGVAGGVRPEPTAPQALAATFSRFLGVRPPKDADVPVPATLESR